MVPEDATFISRHLTPAKRFDAFCESPVVTNMIHDLGGDGEDISKFLKNVGTRKLIDLIGRKYLVTAYVPAMQGNGNPALFVASWVGGYSQLMRWGVFDRALKDFTIHELGNGRKVWIYPCPKLRRGYYISLAVYEGVIAAALSADPMGVLRGISRMRRHEPVVPDAVDWCNERDSDADDEFKLFCEVPPKIGDGFLSLHGKIRQSANQTVLTSVQVGIDGNAAKVAQMVLPEAKDNSNSTLVRVRKVVGDIPGTVFVLPTESIGPLLVLLRRKKELGFWQSVSPLFEKDGVAMVFVSGGRYYGHLMRLKVPSFGLVLPLAKQADTDRSIQAVVAHVNKVWNLGLVSLPDSRHKGLWTIYSNRNKALRKLGKNERPAIVRKDGYLMAVSNVAVLRKMLDQASESKKQLSSASSRGRRVYCGSNFKEMSDILSKGLAVYSLAAMLDSKHRFKRYDTREVKLLLKLLKRLDYGEMWMVPKMNGVYNVECNLRY